MLSRRVLERKRKDEEDTAHVFQEFIETFHQSNQSSKVWVKAGVYDANTREEKKLEIDLYKPSPRIQPEIKNAVTQAQEFARILVKRNDKKKKSNLESFKEELQMMHKDREERQKIKPDKTIRNEEQNPSEYLNSTNLYVNHLNPCIEEVQLIELFGQYGPLASVKIMWPRTEEERNRNKNCGFVAYMSRKDAERALRLLNGTVFMDCELKIGWGKPLLIPPCPIFVPRIMRDMLLPPPPSGLPFNAQPTSSASSSDMDEFLRECIVQVSVPSDKSVLFRIHRTVEFVIREGVLFEAIIMNRELHNPAFRFLFDNQSPDHVYYRWKLYSMLHGDLHKEWRTSDFRMFEGGSIWRPPVAPDYTRGLPDELFEPRNNTFKDLKRSLSNAQRDHLEQLIRRLTPERRSIGIAMVYCIDHIDAYQEIFDVINQSLLSAATIKKIMARLYLLSDIFGNSRISPNVMSFKQLFQNRLTTIFLNIADKSKSLDHQEFLRLKIIDLIEKWRIMNTFNRESLDSYRDAFEINQTKNTELYEPISPTPDHPETPVPEKTAPKFIPSRWETIQPDVVESQAVTTTKWNQLFSSNATHSESKSKGLTESERKRLREIEVKVVEYQDRLESGYESVESGFTVAQQVQEYRRQLMKKYERGSKSGSKKKKGKK